MTLSWSIYRRELRDYAAVSIALLAAAFTGWQGCEARQARIEAHDQFIAAQASASQSSADARADTQRALSVQQQISDRAVEQAKRSADEAAKANAVAIDALHVGQAPIVDAAARFVGGIAEKEKPKVVVTLKNNGKTGASDLRGHVRIVVGEISEDDAYAQPDPKPPSGKHGTTFLSPNASVDLEVFGLPLTATDAEMVKTGQAAIWVFGFTHYKDVFKIPHSLEFCFKYIATTRSMEGCTRHTQSR